MSRIFLGRTGIHSVLLLLALLPSTAARAQDPAVDRLLAAQCAQCHGTDGYAVGDMDELAGESAKDLYEDLTDMKTEDRPENIMDHQALGYTDAQIRRIARYYASLPEDKAGSDVSADGDREERLSSSNSSDDEGDDEDEDEDEEEREREEADD